jgi:hypothetical protein
MATIASLFGPSAEEIVYARKKEDEDYERKRSAARYAGAGEGLGPFGWAAKAGADTGESLRGMFGKSIEDPLISKYNRINQILNEEGGDLNDPKALKRVADRLQSEGYTNEAVRLFDRSSVLGTQQAELDLKASEYGPKLTKDYVLWDGSKVRVDKQGNFYDSNNTLLNEAEVMESDVYNAQFAINKENEIARGKAATQQRLSGVPVREEYVTKDTVTADPNSLEIDADAAKAALPKAGTSGATPGAGSWGQVIADAGAVEGGNVPEEVNTQADQTVIQEEVLSERPNYVEDQPSSKDWPSYIEPKFQFRPGEQGLDSVFQKQQQEGDFSFRPDLADTGGLFKEDMKNIMDLDQTYVPPARSPGREERTLTPTGGPEYSPEILDRIRFGEMGYGFENPRNIEFGQNSTRSGKRDKLLIDMYRGEDFVPTKEDYINLLEELVTLNPDTYGALFNDVKRGAREMTKELGESLRRILTSGKPTEFY